MLIAHLQNMIIQKMQIIQIENMRKYLLQLLKLEYHIVNFQ